MRWYVYVYYNEDHQPYYCGKGCAGRAYKRHDVPVPPRERMVFRYFDEEEHAFQLEKDLIAFWGRKEFDLNGVLDNKALGGPGTPGKPTTKRQKDVRSKLSRSLSHLEHLQRVHNKTRKHYVLTDPDGKVHHIHGLKRFCDKNGLDQACMSRVANGKYKHHKGWTARHA